MDKNNSDQYRILVVDDQVGIVSFLYEFFDSKGYKVLQANNGKKAIQLVQSDSPTVVLLDIRLGWGKDGLEVLKEIKKIAPDTRVIMMTSISDEEVVNEAFSSGADDYIVKPFSLSYLEKIVMLKILNVEIDRIGEGGSVE